MLDSTTTNAASPMEEAYRLAFGAMPMADVLALREGTAWRHFRGAAGQYERLLSIADLDAYLRTDGARTPRVSMADDSREGSAGVPEGEFTLPDGRVDLPRLLARFDRGASLVCSQFQDTHPPLAQFCRGLEKLFLHGVQANIYLTPPAAQGFRSHFDTHDVLVLQVSGRKRWRVWDGEAFPRPTRTTGWDGKTKPVGEPHIVVMEPGDALYIPRGVMHDASTEPGASSLHITLGFLEASWADAMRRLLDTAEQQHAALREAVPTWRLMDEDALPMLAAQLAEKAALLGAPREAERLSVMLLDMLAHDRQPQPARGLFQAPLAADAVMRLADGMHNHVTAGPDGAVLRWTSGELPLSDAEQGWLDALTDGAAADALGEGALEFMQRLYRNGLLERV